jgi:membrane protein
MKNTQSNPGALAAFFQSLRPSIAELRKNDPLRMAGATAFFTAFALPPILFILIQLFGLFLDRKELGKQFLIGISNTLGKGGSAQVRQVLRSIGGFSEHWYVIIIGFLFLIFVATTLFSVIKNSFNQIWQIGIEERPGWRFVLRTRLRSLAVIILAGLLFLADLLGDSLEVITGDYIETIWKGFGGYFRTIIHEGVGILVVILWFIVLFRFLADGRPAWSAAILGGVLTGILFTAGKLVLQFLLVESGIGKIYGASGSVILVLLFVFYSALILYYGASFIYIYSGKRELAIVPTNKAFPYRIEECEVGDNVQT